MIIPTRDQSDHLEQCVEGVLHRTDYTNIELLIIDNGSSEPATVALLDRLNREERRVRILPLPGPFDYFSLNNVAARTAKGEVLLLLNNDIECHWADWLREMVIPCSSTGCGYRGRKADLSHFLFRSLCNRLFKRILNRFQISGIWLQAHFEIIEDRLLVGFRCGDFLELQVAHHDLVAPDRR